MLFETHKTLLKSLSVFLLTLLTSFSVFAEEKKVTDYETVLFLPWTFIQKALQPNSSKVSKFEYDLTNLNVSAIGIPVSIANAHLGVSFKLKPVVAEKSQTFWNTESLSLEVNVSSFKVEKDIIQEIGGAKVVAHLSAQCSSFQLFQPLAHSQMIWDWTVVERNLSARLSLLQLSWLPNSWRISNLHCSGPEGFAELVESELQKQLLQADSFLPDIKNALHSLLNTQMQKLISQWKQPRWLGSEKALRLEFINTGIVHSKGLLLRGALRLNDNSEEINFANWIPLKFKEDVLQTLKDQPQLILSQESMKAVIQLKQLWPESKIELNKLSAFQSLLKSRFLQFFVWPDLWNYSKSSIFNLSSKLKNIPKIQFDHTQSAFNRVYVKASVESHLISQRAGKKWNYIDLQSEINSWVHFDIVNSQLSLKWLKPQISTEQSFNSEYRDFFRPSTYISSSLLKKAIEQAQSYDAYNLELPRLNFGEAYQFSAQSLKRLDANHFIIEWE